jgi:hypothetical protein
MFFPKIRGFATGFLKHSADAVGVESPNGDGNTHRISASDRMFAVCYYNLPKPRDWKCAYNSSQHSYVRSVLLETHCTLATGIEMHLGFPGGFFAIVTAYFMHFVYCGLYALAA